MTDNGQWVCHNNIIMAYSLFAMTATRDALTLGMIQWNSAWKQEYTHDERQTVYSLQIMGLGLWSAVAGGLRNPMWIGCKVHPSWNPTCMQLTPSPLYLVYSLQQQDACSHTYSLQHMAYSDLVRAVLNTQRTNSVDITLLIWYPGWEGNAWDWRIE